MKKQPLSLLIGDVTAILSFLFFSYLLNVPDNALIWLNLAVMALVVSGVWRVVRYWFRAADFRLGFFHTSWRTLLAWLLSAPVIALARHFLIVITHPIYDWHQISLFAILFTFLGGGFFLAGWRMVWWLTWRIQHLPKKAFIKQLSIGSALLFGILILAAGPLRLSLIMRYGNQIDPEDQVDPAPVGLVFGAGVWRSGAPSRVLVDRVKAGVRLYQSGKVDILLMSGGGVEPEVMRDLAIEAGVPPEAILMDPNGLDTRLSCTRAGEVFGFEDVILITQRFHLPRALYLCEASGLSCRGVPADLPGYTPNGWLAMQLREFPAVAKAILEVGLLGR